MASVFKRKGAKRGGKWMLKYMDERGRWRQRTGFPDKDATQRLANRLEEEAFLRRTGVIDSKAERLAQNERRPLAEHVADWEADLQARGGTAKHRRQMTDYCNAVIERCDAQTLPLLSASCIQKAIGSLRDGGKSHTTCNRYLRAVKSFTRWLWQDGRCAVDPAASVRGYNAETDRRYVRAVLSAEELARLIKTTRSGDAYLGVDGPGRALLYLVVMHTGFRRSTLERLQVRHFDLSDPAKPVVTVEARHAKSRKKQVKVIRPDFAAVLHSLFTGKAPDAPAFNVPEKTAKMLKHDLEAARAAWIKEASTPQERVRREASDFLRYETADGVRDFHALRSAFVTMIQKGGGSLTEAQQLAGHADPKTTARHYSRFGSHDLLRGLDALPPIEGWEGVEAPVEEAAAQPMLLKATGTDDAAGADEATEKILTPYMHHDGGRVRPLLALSGVTVQSPFSLSK